MPRVSRLGLGRDESRPVRVRVPNELADEWETYCKTYGEVTAHEGLRQIMKTLVRQKREVQAALPALIERLVQTAKEQRQAAVVPETPVAAVETIDRGKKKRVELGFTPSEYAQLAAIAEERECSVQFWLTSLTRAALTRGITVGGAELKALGEFNYQLMAIGRNLNQITHQINADPGKHLQNLRAETIAQVGAKIDEGRKLTHALVAACSHRWELR